MMAIPLHIRPTISQSPRLRLFQFPRVRDPLHAALVPADEGLALRTLVGHGVERVDATGDAGAERESETGSKSIENTSEDVDNSPDYGQPSVLSD